MNNLRRYYGILMIALPYLADSQVTDTLFHDPGYLLETRMEDYSASISADVDYSQWLEDMDLLKSAPVNINSTSPDELHRLPILNEQQLINIREYIDQYGMITSIYELQNIDGFNQSFIEQIEPYISFEFNSEPRFRLTTALRYGHSKVETRYQRVLEPQSGYSEITDSVRFLKPNQYFNGSPDGLGFRYHFAYRDQLQIGFLAEKDAGEALLQGPDTIPKGFDYYSAHLFLKNLGMISYLAIGDYQARFGQGLTFSTGISMGMTGGTLPSRNRTAILKPHNSFNENSYLRGIATTITLKKFTFTTLVSHRRKDGNQVLSDTSDTFTYISSLQETGYHRTLSEIADEKTVTEKVTGTHLQWNSLRWLCGVSYYQLAFSSPIIKDAPPGTMQNNLTPGSNFAGIDYCYSYKRLTTYGEFSKQLKGGYAIIQGLNMSLHPMLALAAVFRNYGSQYTNVFSAGFGNSSSHTREYAFYTGMEAIFRKFTLTAFTDFAQYQGLKYRVDAPSTGSALGMEFLYSMGRKGEIRVRYRHSINPINLEMDYTSAQKIGNASRKDYQWSLTYQPLSWFKTGNKIYACQFREPGSSKNWGYLFSQDLKLQIRRPELSVSCRYAVFDTDSYESRIYSYENDLPSSFSVPSMNGRGSRFYVMISTHPLEEIEVWLRVSGTFYDENQTISEGAAEISTSHRTEAKVMISYRF